MSSSKLGVGPLPRRRIDESCRAVDLVLPGPAHDASPLLKPRLGTILGSKDSSRKGSIISEIHDMGGVQFAYFADPDGNRWVIQGATPPDVRAAHLD